MASNYTTNYSLCQWQPTDQVQRTDFNADNAKLDAALAGKLGHAELIRTVTLEGGGSLLEVALNDIDWNEWEFVLLTMTDDLSAPDGLHKVHLTLNNGTIPCYNSADTGNIATMTGMPFLLMLLPLHDSSRQLRYVHIGAPSGVGAADCTFADVEKIQIAYESPQYGMNSGTSVRVWGMQ